MTTLLQNSSPGPLYEGATRVNGAHVSSEHVVGLDDDKVKDKKLQMDKDLTNHESHQLHQHARSI